ncbi:type I restriction-modification system subunit M N-terminal domain-containing protein [Agriterribacter humi]|nr:type I restriction-modification system subunit M N-terminal domain-containing protein [Agriterribacter humi]
MAKEKTAKEEPLEKQLWKAADKMRKNIDAAEYKHICAWFDLSQIHQRLL